jgi:ubiquinone/menaquinone biosynthesis C-methylase UbiE
MSTTWEQLEGAALSLARSGTIKDRLTDAYRNHLSLVNIDDLPEALREEFRACHAALTRERPLRGEDAVRATVRKMSNHEADEIACSVIRLFAGLVREISRAEASTDPACSFEATPAAAPVAATLVLNGASATARARMRKAAVPQVIAR